jgi:hypothetical protein
MMEELGSLEMLVLTRATLLHFPEDVILQGRGYFGNGVVNGRKCENIFFKYVRFR